MKVHEVLLTWSLLSGKEYITLDGREEHHNQKGRTSICDHKWTTRDNYELHVVTTREPPLKSPPNFRCYELLLNGRSFFNLPKPGQTESRQRSTEYEIAYGAPSSIVEILYPGLLQKGEEDSEADESRDETSAAAKASIKIFDEAALFGDAPVQQTEGTAQPPAPVQQQPPASTDVDLLWG